MVTVKRSGSSGSGGSLAATAAAAAAGARGSRLYRSGGGGGGQNYAFIFAPKVAVAVVVAILVGMGVALRRHRHESATSASSSSDSGSNPSMANKGLAFDNTSHESYDEKRTRTIVDFINQVTLTNQVLTLHPTNIGVGATKLSAEEQALQWLVYDDPLKRSLLLPDTPSNRFRLQQRYALRTLWFQQALDVAPWFQTTGWDGNTLKTKPSKEGEDDECNWYGIVCVESTIVTDDNTENVGVVTTTVTHPIKAVSEIVLVKNNLSGTLPPDLALLSHNLHIVKLSYNALKSTIPSSLGRWTQLQHVALSFNGLMGSLPESIGRGWTYVQTVDFHDNDLSGSLPSSIGNGWSQIIKLVLPSNRLTGSLPSSLQHWHSIETLNLNRNALTGSLSAAVVSQWTALQDVGLAYNDFSGTLPAEAMAAAWSGSSIRYIGLDHNAKLTGRIPSELCDKAKSPHVSAIWVDCPDQVACACCIGCTSNV